MTTTSGGSSGTTPGLLSNATLPPNRSPAAPVKADSYSKTPFLEGARSSSRIDFISAYSQSTQGDHETNRTRPHTPQSLQKFLTVLVYNSSF